VSYSADTISSDIVNIIRDLNENDTPDNIITTHATISNNTEVFIMNEPQTEGTVANMCVICQDEITNPSILRKIKKCSHHYHINCLDKWLENKITCPTCRCDIRLNLNNQEESSVTSTEI
jgi:hypothetical protein